MAASRRYRPLFTKKELEGRFIDLFDMAETFQQRYEAHNSVKLELSTDRLYMIVISTYDDIARYKYYHLSNPYEERSNPIKRAAYLTKWISRFKPWHVVSGNDSAETYLVNEVFAITVAVVNLNVHTDRDFWLSVEKEYELVYDLMYRSLSDDALLILYKTIVDHVTGVTFTDLA